MPIGSGGIMIDGLYSVEYAVNNLALPYGSGTGSTGSIGITVGEFEPRRIRQAKIESPPPAQLKFCGVKVDIYDPYLAAVMAGEL